IPTSNAGMWVIWYQAFEQGKLVGEASYLQTILSPQDQQTLTKLEEYLGRADGLSGKLDPAKTVAIDGAHVATQSAGVTRVRLFVGADKGNANSFRLIDLTPGIDPKGNQLEFTGSTPDAALQSFFKDQRYPKGHMTLQIPGNSIGLATNKWDVP